MPPLADLPHTFLNALCLFNALRTLRVPAEDIYFSFGKYGMAVFPNKNVDLAFFAGPLPEGMPQEDIEAEWLAAITRWQAASPDEFLPIYDAWRAHTDLVKLLTILQQAGIRTWVRGEGDEDSH